MLLMPELVPAMVGTFMSRQAQRIAICFISKQIDQFSKKRSKRIDRSVFNEALAAEPADTLRDYINRPTKRKRISSTQKNESGSLHFLYIYPYLTNIIKFGQVASGRARNSTETIRNRNKVVRNNQQ